MYSVICGLKDFSILMRHACAVCLIEAGIRLRGRPGGWTAARCCVLLFSIFFMLSSMAQLGIGTYFLKVKESGRFAVVLRNGLKQQIPITGVVVGDIVCLKSGDKIPADGLFLDCDQSLKLAESHLRGIAGIVEIDHANPFLLAGAKLIEVTVWYTKQGSLYQEEVTQTRLHARILARYFDRAKLILAVSYLPISLARYFSGNSKNSNGNSEYNQGTTTASEVLHVIIETIVAVSAISIAMDTTNFSWALKVSLANAIDKMAALNIVVRDLSAWEKVCHRVAKINVVDGNNTSTIEVEASKFLFVPQFIGAKEVPLSISPNVVELAQQGISLNTIGIAYHAVRTHKIDFSGSPCERAILSQAALELDMNWERLNQDCTILKAEALEMGGRRVWMQKDGAFHLHMRGPADMILKVCSSFYDASGSLSSLNENTRNLLEEKLRSVDAGGRIEVLAFAHRQVSEEELKSDQDLIGKERSHSLLGFLVLKEIKGDQILKEVAEECLNAGAALSLIINENPVDAVAELLVHESNRDLKYKTSVEGVISKEDDKSVSMGSGSELTTENSTGIAISDRRPDSDSMYQLKVARFCIVEELTGSETLTSTSPIVLELLKQGIGLKAAENVVSCDHRFLESPIEKAVLSWAIHELNLNLDLEEPEKNITISRSENYKPENEGMGFLMSLEDGTLHVHKRGPAENILKMCSSYYCRSGEKRVLGGQERMLLEQRLQDLASSKCQWVAFVHSQDSQDCSTLLGILILDQENPRVNEDVRCHADDSVVLEPNDANGAMSNSTAEDEARASSEENLLVSMCIEGDETTRRSDIVILDGNYSSLTLILRWANCVLRNTRTFLQFQLTTSITSILNTYSSIITLPGTRAVRTRLMYLLVQLIWVDWGMGLIAAVTFGMQKPRPSNFPMRKRIDEGGKWQLVTGFMWRNIMAQVVYQALIISILQFRGPATFGIRNKAKDTVTFVMPMFLQAFNIINARKIEEKNIFSGTWPSFIWLVAILIVVPFMLMEILAHFVEFEGLDWKQWTICIGIAMLSLPVGFAVRFLPLGFFVTVINKLKALLRQLRN